MNTKEKEQAEKFRELMHKSVQPRVDVEIENTDSSSENTSVDSENTAVAENASSLDEKSIEDLINNFENFTYRHIEKNEIEEIKKADAVIEEEAELSDNNKKSKKAKKTHKILKSVLIIIAILFICCASLIAESLVKQSKNYSFTANRDLTIFSDFSFARLSSGEFAEELEQSVSFFILDNSKFVRNILLGKRIDGQTEYNGVYIGKNNRLYLKPAAENKEKLSASVNVLKNIASDFNIPNKAAIIVPDACYIIPDDLPDIHDVPEQANQIGNIYSDLKKSGYDCIDVCRLFKKSDDKQSLYFKSDHHWTARAAETVFETLALQWNIDTSEIENDFYTLSNTFIGNLSVETGIFDYSDKLEICLPDNSTGLFVAENFDTRTKTTSLFDKSMLSTSSPYDVFLGGNSSQLTIKAVNITDFNLLIIKDSFANCFIPMLTPYFGKITVIDPVLFRGDISEIVKTEDFTHLLVLYNLYDLLTDTSLNTFMNN